MLVRAAHAATSDATETLYGCNVEMLKNLVHGFHSVAFAIWNIATLCAPALPARDTLSFQEGKSHSQHGGLPELRKSAMYIEGLRSVSL